jgi:serine protease
MNLWHLILFSLFQELFWWHLPGKSSYRFVLNVLSKLPLTCDTHTHTLSLRNGADDNPPNLVNYPADYDEVLSIAAVDSLYRVAGFSNYNEHVDMAAVGVDVVSAYALPSGGTQTDIVYNAGTFSGIQMIYSKYVSGDGVTGTLVNCELGSGTCPGSGGHVCLIERGGSSYHQKVANCEQSNGVAAIIYNNNDGAVKGNFGTVGNSPRFTSIPAVGIPRDMGLQLLAMEGTEVTISSPLASNGYGTMSGTSMA